MSLGLGLERRFLAHLVLCQFLHRGFVFSVAARLSWLDHEVMALTWRLINPIEVSQHSRYCCFYDHLPGLRLWPSVPPELDELNQTFVGVIRTQEHPFQIRVVLLLQILSQLSVITHITD